MKHLRPHLPALALIATFVAFLALLAYAAATDNFILFSVIIIAAFGLLAYEG